MPSTWRFVTIHLVYAVPPTTDLYVHQLPVYQFLIGQYDILMSNNFHPQITNFLF